MMFERYSIALGDGETVSAVTAQPETPAAPEMPAIILGHGAGNDMNSAFLSAVHEGLARRGYPAVKFNFPYKERGGRAPDRTAVLENCYRRVLDHVRARPPGRRIVIGGKSLGGRIASHLAAQGADIAGLLLLGYPLHPPRKPTQLRIAHLAKIQVPMCFFAGTRDPLCDLELLRRTLDSLSARWQLHVVEGGDHSFNLPKSLHREAQAVWDEIIEVSAVWLGTLTCQEPPSR